MRLREDLAQRTAEQCVSRALRPKRGRGGQEAVSPTLPLTTSWLLRPDQGRRTLGQVLKTMKIGIAKKQVLQSIAGAFPGNAVLHKWGVVASAAYALCASVWGSGRDTEPHPMSLPCAERRPHPGAPQSSTPIVEGYLGGLKQVPHMRGTDS